MPIWTFDPLHTQVEFSAKHLGMMTVRGHFAEVTAGGDIDVDHPENSSIQVTISTASIRTHNARRDDDLRSSNFLEVRRFPTITFTSSQIEPGDAEHFDLTGDLTIKGETRPVTLHVTKYGEFTDPNMGHRVGYAAEARINRQDYGMKFDMMLDGKFIVSNEVQISIEGELLDVEGTQVAGASSG